ncbi:MAG: hypothetical protein R3Y47_04150 [Lachnospiraceae bacterium]
MRPSYIIVNFLIFCTLKIPFCGNGGYVTVANDIFLGDSLVLKIPNEEVLSAFKKLIGEYTGLGDESLKDLFDFLIVKKDLEAFKKMYQKMVYDSRQSKK